MQCVFDLDGVICDMMTCLVEYSNKRFNKSLKYEDLKNYDCAKMLGFSSRSEFLDGIVESASLENGAPINSTIEVMNKLKEKGFFINVITARGFHPQAEKVTRDWLSSHSVPFDRLIVSGESKIESFSKLGKQSFIIDDYPMNLIDADKSGVFENIFLMDQPWNDSFSKCERIFEINDLLNVGN